MEVGSFCDVIISEEPQLVYVTKKMVVMALRNVRSDSSAMVFIAM